MERSLHGKVSVVSLEKKGNARYHVFVITMSDPKS